MIGPDYDGDLSAIRLKNKGAYGIGTLHALDGELVVNDKKLHHCRNGKAHTLSGNEKIAWASLHDFVNPEECTSDISYDTMEKFILEKELSETRDFVGIVVKGLFSVLKLTSTPKQKKPYPSIADVIRKSHSYYFSSIPGIAVGYYVPNTMSMIQNPGIHLHFISDDEKIGGHVLDFYAESAKIILEKISKIELEL